MPDLPICGICTPDPVLDPPADPDDVPELDPVPEDDDPDPDPDEDDPDPEDDVPDPDPDDGDPDPVPEDDPDPEVDPGDWPPPPEPLPPGKKRLGFRKLGPPFDFPVISKRHIGWYI